ncbi:hypothetical protein MGMO_37c00190 [Methyloglobulus morosus KoM1]|uniref:Uncharacterized protein n=1 Tax=Methyloglobulus morosus KoM1 TaxID=1116472 RepID=V5C8N4_9GAMM|nr:hypothetical protein MGMO_37c00190 [Methyloglobulus morosus KoM1]
MSTEKRQQLTHTSQEVCQQARTIAHTILFMFMTVAIFMSCVGVSIVLNLP